MVHSEHSYLCLTQQRISQSLPTSKEKQEELCQERERGKENRKRGENRLQAANFKTVVVDFKRRRKRDLEKPFPLLPGFDLWGTEQNGFRWKQNE